MADGDPERISTWDLLRPSFGGYSDWFIPSKDELDVFLESSVKYNVLAEGEGYALAPALTIRAVGGVGLPTLDGTLAMKVGLGTS